MKKYKEWFKKEGHMPSIGKKPISKYSFQKNEITKTYKSRKGNIMAEWIIIEFFEIQGNIFYPEQGEKISINDGELTINYYEEEYSIDFKIIEKLVMGDTYIIPKKGYRYDYSMDKMYCRENGTNYIADPQKITKINKDTYLFQKTEVDGDDEISNVDEYCSLKELKKLFIKKDSSEWTINIYENNQLIDCITKANYKEYRY